MQTAVSHVLTADLLIYTAFCKDRYSKKNTDFAFSRDVFCHFKWKMAATNRYFSLRGMASIHAGNSKNEITKHGNAAQA